MKPILEKEPPFLISYLDSGIVASFLYNVCKVFKKGVHSLGMKRNFLEFLFLLVKVEFGSHLYSGFLLSLVEEFFMCKIKFAFLIYEFYLFVIFIYIKKLLILIV